MSFSNAVKTFNVTWEAPMAAISISLLKPLSCRYHHSRWMESDCVNCWLLANWLLCCWQLLKIQREHIPKIRTWYFRAKCRLSMIGGGIHIRIEICIPYDSEWIHQCQKLIFSVSVNKSMLTKRKRQNSTLRAVQPLNNTQRAQELPCNCKNFHLQKGSSCLQFLFNVKIITYVRWMSGNHQ